ncbi:hypothetical protein [Thermococcus chitonophagus]|nr:hypothetical protein [Thermococcus chitonophagus]
MGDGFITSINVYPADNSSAFIVVAWAIGAYGQCPGLKRNISNCSLDPINFTYYTFYFDGNSILYLPQLSNTDSLISFNGSELVYLYGENPPKIGHNANYYLLDINKKCVLPLGNRSKVFKPIQGVPGEIRDGNVVFSNGSRMYAIPLYKLLNYTILGVEDLRAVFLKNGILIYPASYMGSKDWGYPYVVLPDIENLSRVKIARIDELPPVSIFFYDGKELKAFPLYRITYRNSELMPDIVVDRTVEFSSCRGWNSWVVGAFLILLIVLVAVLKKRA